MDEQVQNYTPVNNSMYNMSMNYSPGRRVGNDPETLVTYKVMTAMQLYLTPSLLVLGTISNVTCLAVLLCSKLNLKNATLLYLTTQTAFNLVCIWVTCGTITFTHLFGVLPPILIADWLCKIWPLLEYVPQSTSFWLTFAAVTERNMRLSRPRSAKYYCSSLGAKAFIFFITVGSALIAVHSLWTNELATAPRSHSNGVNITMCESIANSHFFLSIVWKHISHAFFECIPLVGVYITSSFLVYNLCKKTKTNREGQNIPTALDRQTTHASLAFAVALMLLATPETILGVIGPMVDEPSSVEKAAQMYLILETFKSARYLWYSLNFFLCMATLPAFRHQIKNCTLRRGSKSEENSIKLKNMADGVNKNGLPVRCAIEECSAEVDEATALKQHHVKYNPKRKSNN